MIDNPCDHREEIAELKRMIRELGSVSNLGNSAISSGSLQVATPEGIYVKPGASIDNGDMKIANTGGTGSLKAGPSEVSKDGVGAGGTKIRPDGKIGNDINDLKFASNSTFEGNLKSAGTVEAQVVKGNLQVEAGGTRIRSDGSIIHDDGPLELASNLEGASNGTFQGAVRGHQGVIAPVNGTMTQLGPLASQANTTASQALARANSAMTKF